MPIQLAILSDNEAETAAEELSVTISAASSAGAVRLGGPSNTYAVNRNVTISANAQFAWTVSVSVPSAELAEPLTRSSTTDKAVFTLSVTQDPGSAAARSGAATIAYAIGGSAVSADYIAPAGYTASTMSGTVQLAEADSSETVTFPIEADNLNEGDETIVFTLGAISGAAFTNGNLGPAASAADRSATATIGENDALQVLVGRSTESLNEGETVTFTVNLQPVGAPATLSTRLTMPYTLSGVEAADVSGGTLGGTLTIMAGDGTGEIEIRAVADNLNEAAETLTLNIACDAPGTAGPVAIATALCNADTGMARIPPVTIAASNDITISIAAPTDALSEGSDAVFAVTLAGASAGSEGPITLPYSVADFIQDNTGAANTAENPDIEGGMAGGALSGQMITIPAGTASGVEIRIPLRQDGLAEGAETFTVTLGTPAPGSGAGAVSPGTSQASATIPANAEFTRFLSVTIGSEDSTGRTAEVTEGATARFNVELLGEAPETDMLVTVNWSVSGTVESTDHDCTSGTLIFRVLESQPINCSIRQDGLNEGAETLIFTLANPSGGGTGNVGIRTAQSSATATIPASNPITYSIAGPAGVFTEGAMSPQNMALTLDFSVSLTASSEGEIVIPFAVNPSGQPGTAQGGVASDNARDFTTPTLSVTIPAGQTSETIAIEVHNDRRNEARETVVLALLAELTGGFSAGAGAGGGDADYRGGRAERHGDDCR